MRRKAIQLWAGSIFGLIGRGPDHVVGFLAAFASTPAPEVFARRGQRFADNVMRFYEHVRDKTCSSLT